MTELFDVVAVDMETHKVRLIAEGKTERKAEAVETMAVVRRGVEKEFFATVKHRRYGNGDEWSGIDDTL